ncbi:Uncharacterised protein [Legionella londiniensis]|uniref:Transglutaminase-like domain-containing protein n=1 Tax=Legionella londiniensis TaxID=45068 RepID=A0A0W0VN89_9GAMM|nr:hypothetical protein Llon_1487 [Legionella londiniensis]STX93554.1 Uncharacterised protein [Legionella londiniensis]
MDIKLKKNLLLLLITLLFISFAIFTFNKDLIKKLYTSQPDSNYEDKIAYWKSEVNRVIEERERGAYIENRLVDATANLRIYSYAYFPEYPEIFNKHKIFTFQEKTWEDLKNSAIRQYDIYKDHLNSTWHIDGNLSKGIYLMNTVHNLYHEYVSSPKGHRNARENQQNMHPETYLKAEHGDCKDYAMLLYMLFNSTGIPAKQVGTGDHVYIEASIDGQNYIFDPTFNFYTRQTNQNFLNQSLNQQIDYHLFPYIPDVDRIDNAKLILPNNLYVYLYTRGRIFRGKEEKNYLAVNQYPKWIKQNYIPVKTIRNG